MFKYFYILFFSIIVSNTQASDKVKIIENLQNTENLRFNFEQNINGKIENGSCTIEYPKKIFCNYNKSNGKILVSNGKSLVIKTKVGFYRYSLKKTPLNLILDKKFLIKKIYDLEEKIVNDLYINYTINENDNEINVFFNNKTFNLTGWQTKDIYQNQNLTHLSAIKINQKINKSLFKLPQPN
tara:strand:+ start:265 stop:813 length:549 start_codon:yes stop_codon:yes gene_type:complete